ncbi:uncharacterized protein METZ01_LOCUS231625, partial [marine metagenome]
VLNESNTIWPDVCSFEKDRSFLSGGFL